MLNVFESTAVESNRDVTSLYLTSKTLLTQHLTSKSLTLNSIQVSGSKRDSRKETLRDSLSVNRMVKKC
jgi:hypothetical protein